MDVICGVFQVSEIVPVSQASAAPQSGNTDGLSAEARDRALENVNTTTSTTARTLSTSLGDMIRQAVDSLFPLLPSTWCLRVLIRDQGENVLRVVSDRGVGSKRSKASSSTSSSVKMDTRSTPVEVFERVERVVVKEGDTTLSVPPQTGDFVYKGGYIGTPLFVQDDKGKKTAMGVLEVATGTSSFTDTDVDFLSQWADALSRCIQNHDVRHRTSRAMNNWLSDTLDPESASSFSVFIVDHGEVFRCVAAGAGKDGVHYTETSPLVRLELVERTNVQLSILFFIFSLV
jgi:hypothetical protein